MHPHIPIPFPQAGQTHRCSTLPTPPLAPVLHEPGRARKMPDNNNSSCSLQGCAAAFVSLAFGGSHRSGRGGGSSLQHPGSSRCSGHDALKRPCHQVPTDHGAQQAHRHLQPRTWGETQRSGHHEQHKCILYKPSGLHHPHGRAKTPAAPPPSALRPPRCLADK